MNNRLRRLARNESGMTYVFIGLGFMAFLSASMLAIDVGMLMTARNQAQNAADAGALAGATALLYDDWNDRSPGGPAVTSSIGAATNNKVMAGIVSVNPEDVEFPLDPAGQPNRVKVTVRRTAARGNPVSTLIAKYFGTATADIGATATAEVSPANAMTCVKPFTVPDRWTENQNRLPGTATTPTTRSTTRDARSPIRTSISPPTSRDTPATTRSRCAARCSPSAPRPETTSWSSFYFSLALGKPVITGGAEYDWNIANCNKTIYHYGDPLTQEPGAKSWPDRLRRRAADRAGPRRRTGIRRRTR